MSIESVVKLKYVIHSVNIQSGGNVITLMTSGLGKSVKKDKGADLMHCGRERAKGNICVLALPTMHHFGDKQCALFKFMSLM